MEIEIYKDPFRTVSFEKSKKMLHQIWHKATDDMTVDEYKKAALSLVEEVGKHGAIRILNNAVESQFVVTPELQDWFNANVATRLLKSGVQKYAIILPDELFTQVSVEQIVDDTVDVVKDKINYFNSEENALEWMV